MAKQQDGYLSAKESRRISKENRRITDQYEKQRKRKNVPESEYLTQMKNPENAVEFDNLHTYFFTDTGVVKSVDGVSFEVPVGKTVGVVGESGCGKSVTAKSIMGLIKAPQGEIKENSEILYHGENILKYNKKQWQHYKGGECAIIFQDALASLNPTMRVGKQIMENLMGHKNMTKQEAAKEAVEMLLSLIHISEPTRH